MRDGQVSQTQAPTGEQGMRKELESKGTPSQQEQVEGKAGKPGKMRSPGLRKLYKNKFRPGSCLGEGAGTPLGPRKSLFLICLWGQNSGIVQISFLLPQ